MKLENKAETIVDTEVEKIDPAPAAVVNEAPDAYAEKARSDLENELLKMESTRKC